MRAALVGYTDRPFRRRCGHLCSFRNGRLAALGPGRNGEMKRLIVFLIGIEAIFLAGAFIPIIHWWGSLIAFVGSVLAAIAAFAMKD